METHDQIWTQWKEYEKPEKQIKNEDDLRTLPAKPQIVLEFEKSSFKDKSEIRYSSEWPEIAKYYNEYHSIIQHNMATHAFRMRKGIEPIGKVQYIGNTFIIPIHYPTPKDQHWEKGPDNIYHKPSCQFRISNYTDSNPCHCGKGRERNLFGKGA